MQEEYGFENFQDNQQQNGYNGDQGSVGGYKEDYHKKGCNCHCKKQFCREPKVFERKCCYKQRWYFTESDTECGNWYKC
ncbi:MAG: hypothetical protein N2749_03395 [Clostridia bacterium]|nr:hypothetical protein [Clostridia bacterium]